MIVLERIDLADKRADFRLHGPLDTAAQAAFGRASALARQLGLSDVQLLHGNAAGSSPGGGEGAPARGCGRTPREAAAGMRSRAIAVAVLGTAADAQSHAPLPRHCWGMAGDAVGCEIVFAHDPGSRDLVALWMPLVLVCSGAAEETLMQLHTGLYEICANILEHGRPLRHPGEFSIVLRFHADRIEGYVQDCCERFDSASPPLQGLLERFDTGARRGFGIHMMLRLIDHLQHEYNETGNRLVFTKGIKP